MRGLLHLLCLLGVLATTVPASSSSTLTPRRHQPAKRDYARSSYFVLELSNPSLSPYQAAQALELDVVEQVGELQGHWLVSTSQGNNRHPTVLDQFDRLRRKRAPHLSGVLRLDPQIPRQRVKRVFTPELSLQPRQRQSKVSDYIQALVKKFAIQDPIFKEQWHLANDRMRDNDVNVTGVWEQDISGVGTTVAVIDDGLDSQWSP